MAAHIAEHEPHEMTVEQETFLVTNCQRERLLRAIRFYREEVEPNEGHGGSQKRARERQVLIQQVQESRHAAHKRKKRAVRRYPQGNHGALSNRTRDLLFRSYFHLLDHCCEPRCGGDRRSSRDRKAVSGLERYESFGP